MNVSDLMTALIPSDPAAIAQATVLFVAAALLFLLLFTLRDILLRTHSFAYQFSCVLLVGFVPVLGFLVYLLIRPARTIKERELEALVREMAGEEGHVEFDLGDFMGMDFDDDEEEESMPDAENDEEPQKEPAISIVEMDDQEGESEEEPDSASKKSSSKK